MMGQLASLLLLVVGVGDLVSFCCGHLCFSLGIVSGQEKEALDVGSVDKKPSHVKKQDRMIDSLVEETQILVLSENNSVQLHHQITQLNIEMQ